MNLFARILSHGFALLVVAVLAIGLVYRGELFPDLEMPAFLTFEGASDSETDSSRDTVSGDDSMQSPTDVPVEAQLTAETVPADTHEPPAEPGRITPEAVDSVPTDDATVVSAPAYTAPDASEAVADVSAEAQLVADAVPVDRRVPPAEPGEITPAAVDSVPIADAPVVSVPAYAAPDASEAVDDRTGVPDTLSAIDAGKVDEGAVSPVVTEMAPTSTTQAKDAGPSGLPGDSVPASDLSLPADLPGQDDAPAVDAGDAATAQAASETVQTGGAAHGVDALTVDAVQPSDKDPSGSDQPAAAEAASKSAETPYQLLAAAREAYWLRDYATAEQKYQAMINLDPDNPDGHGELGNMYFSQGKWDLASASYFEAGKRLADEGQMDQAQQLVEVLRGLQGPQADELAQYVDSKAANNQ